MTTLVNHYCAQFRLVRTTLNAWRPDPSPKKPGRVTDAVRDLEELTQECLDGVDRTVRLLKDVWDCGFAGELDNVQEMGQNIVEMLDSEIETLDAMAERARIISHQGGVVRNAGQLPAAVQKVRILADDFKTRWPFIQTEDVQRGAQEIARGELVTGEELLRELQRRGG